MTTLSQVKLWTGIFSEVWEGEKGWEGQRRPDPNMSLVKGGPGQEAGLEDGQQRI